MASGLSGFSSFEWTHEGTTKTVYHKGKLTDPPVVLMHELPGMVPQTVRLAEDLVEEGFVVFLPLMFGVPNAPIWGVLPYTAQVCLSQEFSLFAKGKTSGLITWMKSLCREAKRRCHDRSVGVIGMCLTGNFALALMTDDAVLAPVLSQPSLPIGLSERTRADLATSPADLDAAQARSARENIPVLALRFNCDRLCQAPRFGALEKRFGERFRKIELDSSPGNPHGLSGTSHSVLSVHRVRKEGHPTQKAYREVVAFLKEQLVIID